MGKTESKIIHTIPEETLQSYEAEYKILGLTSRDICLLHNIFREILHDDDEVTIQLEDLLNYFSLEKTSLTKLIFTSFDIDLLNIGAIDFPRFLQGLWNFCTLEDDALSMSILSISFYQICSHYG